MANVADTIIDPAELVELAPELTVEQATRALTLAVRVIAAYLYPYAIPDPAPPPLTLILIRLALRITRSSTTTSGGRVVSETLGSYTYRLERPLTLDDALGLLDDLAAELEPWALKGAKVYDIDTTGQPGLVSPLGLVNAGRLAPADHFQRNFDNDDPELAGGAVATS